MLHPLIARVAPILIFAGLSATATAVAGAPTPDEILKAVDNAVGGMADQYFITEMTTDEPGKASRTLTLEVTIKGSDWRRIEFLAPGDVKGTRILVLSTDQTYIYLPAFRKIRRIATHLKEQGFMGSAWDNDDFSLATYGKVFEAEAVTDHDKYYTLALKRRAGVDFLYPRIEVDARKDGMQPIEIRYFNDVGATVKTETRTVFVCQAGLCIPKVVVIVDHTRADIKTTMTIKDWKVNRGVPDSFFTIRALQRGE